MLMKKLYLFSRSAVKEEKLDSSRLRGNFFSFLFSFSFFTSTPNHSVFPWGGRNIDATTPNLILILPPLFATLETRGGLEPKYVLGSFLGTCQSAIGQFFPSNSPKSLCKS